MRIGTPDLKSEREEMELTEEQKRIVKSTGSIKINAVAGSGKTTTIVEYAAARPGNSRILYLAFNKSVKLEAIRRFEERGLGNVKVETAHSLAYRNVVYRNRYRVRPQGYRTYEIAEILGLKGSGEEHAEYVIANHINRFAAYFCNSDARKVQELDYLDVVSDEKARAIVTTYYDYIEKKTRSLLGRMDKGDIEITHDFYLKKFQLSDPWLPYEYILFDEGQDASPAMLDVFFRQDATKVIVGDTHQQIYGWRHAVNSLERADFKTYNLTTSFRFNQAIANLAMGVLRWKDYLGTDGRVLIHGRGSSREDRSRAILARTNLGLLLKAIEYISEGRRRGRIYFEGNINSYTYADDGASLYDVLSLYNGNRKMIRDKLISQMKDIQELEDYVEKTEDTQIGMMVDIVNEYGNEIPGLLHELKARHVANDDREKAEAIFSTVHRSKGMEYDNVELVGDFITEKKLERIKDDRERITDAARLNEEINLLYVAVTRAKSRVTIPDELVPGGVSASAAVRLLSTQTAGNGGKPWSRPVSGKRSSTSDRDEAAKTYSVDKMRARHKEAYRPWNDRLDHELTALFHNGVSTRELAKHFGRTAGAIRARIKKLEL